MLVWCLYVLVWCLYVLVWCLFVHVQLCIFMMLCRFIYSYIFTYYTHIHIFSGSFGFLINWFSLHSESVFKGHLYIPDILNISYGEDRTWFWENIPLSQGVLSSECSLKTGFTVYICSCLRVYSGPCFIRPPLRETVGLEIPLRSIPNDHFHYNKPVL